MRRLLPSLRARFWPRHYAWRAIPISLAILVSLALASSALAATYSVTITAPAQNATGLSPDVTVTVDTGGLTLVPGPQATGPNDLHIHYMLDTDVTPYLDGKVAVPTGNPNIVHSAANTHLFQGLAPGTHKVTVLLTDSTHHAVQPPVHPSVTFTVGSVPTTSSGGSNSTSSSGSSGGVKSLPKAGGLPAEVVDLFAAFGAVLVFIGLTVRRSGPRPVRETARAYDHPSTVKDTDPNS